MAHDGGRDGMRAEGPRRDSTQGSTGKPRGTTDGRTAPGPVPRPACRPEDLRLAIAAIFKNEAPYVLEWIAFHRAVGIDRFLVADNASSDGTTEILEALDRAGVLTHIPFPGIPGEPPQLPAYRAMLQALDAEDAARRPHWVALIDADEFLMPAPPARSVREAIAALHGDPSVGVIAVNWAVYGSSGHRTADSRPVIERFTLRAERDATTHHHFKSILRPEAFAATALTPHAVRLRPGFRTVHADGRPLRLLPGRADGLSAETLWAPLRLNHYVVKSREEFERKRQRGRAMRNEQRAAAFFERHDHYRAADPVPPWLLAATVAEMDRLAQAAGLAGPGVPHATPNGTPAGEREAARRPEATVAAAQASARPPESAATPAGGAGEPPRPDPGSDDGRWRTGRQVMQTVMRRVRGEPRGTIDRVEIDGDSARISGWVLAPAAEDGAEELAGFAVTLDGRPVELVRARRVERPDVARKLRDAPADCGFELTVAWPGTWPAAAAGALRVTTGGPPERAFAIPAETATWHRADASEGAGEAPPPAVPDAPILPPRVVAHLRAAIARAGCYLEYGSGGSTVLAVRSALPVLVSIESDAAWLAAVRAKLAGEIDPTRHHLLHGDIGPTGRFGRPVSERHWRRFADYALAPWDLCARQGLAPDLVLVDGRFRAACFLATLLHARPGTRVLFDDYAGREGYHGVEAFAVPRRRIGRMAEFAVPRPGDPAPLWRAFLAALGDPL